MTPVGFELTIPACKRPKTHVLDRAATGIRNMNLLLKANSKIRDADE